MTMDEQGMLPSLYSLLVQVLEYPGNHTHSPEHLAKWHNELLVLNGIMMQFYPQELVGAMDRIEETMSGFHPKNDDELMQAYDYCFQLLSITGKGFKSQSLLLEHESGLKVIHDQFVAISRHPININLTPSGILQWYEMIRSLHYLLISYFNKTHLTEYEIIIKNLKEASGLYPSDEYVLKSRQWLINWIGLIARVLQEKNVLVPEDLTYSDSVRGAKA